MMSKTISMREVAKHNSADDCWLVIHGKVYDLTDFARTHPGGSKVIQECAGKVQFFILKILFISSFKLMHDLIMKFKSF